jgi:hypothetical protein
MSHASESPNGVCRPALSPRNRTQHTPTVLSDDPRIQITPHSQQRKTP